MRRQTLTNGERFIIPQLKEYEEMALTARDRIEELERDLYRRVCGQLTESAEAVQRLAGGIAAVDALASLATVAVNNRYVRPSVNTGDEISIKDGRHPVVELTLDAGLYVPNDVHLSPDARIILLTGPQHGRQVHLHPPGSRHRPDGPDRQLRPGRVRHHRAGRPDLHAGRTAGRPHHRPVDLHGGDGRDRRHPQPGHPSIPGHPGRDRQGQPAPTTAWPSPGPFVEHLHNDPRFLTVAPSVAGAGNLSKAPWAPRSCKSLFATHYHELTDLASTLPGVSNFNVAVAEDGEGVVFLHRIVPGGADQSYGVQVARLAGLPPAVISRAWEVLNDLERPSSHANGASDPAPAPQGIADAPVRPRPGSPGPAAGEWTYPT